MRSMRECRGLPTLDQGEKIGEFYWGPLFGSGIETWLAYVIALVFLLFRPQGLFGEKIIERI